MRPVFVRFISIILFVAIIGQFAAYAYPEQVFEMAQQKKSRVFLDRLATGPVDYSVNADKTLAGKEKEIRGQLMNAEFAALCPKDKKAGLSFIGFPTEAVNAILEKYDDLLMKIKVSNPNPPNASAAFPKLDAIKNEIPTDAILLEYFIERDKGYLLVLTNENLRMIELDTGEEMLDNMIKTFMADVDKGTIMEVVLARGRELSRRLGLDKIKDELKEKNTIIVAPHGVLHRLPFQILPLKSERMLIEDYSVLYTPSATAYYQMKFRQAHKTPGSNTSLLIYELQKENPGAETCLKTLEKHMKPGKLISNDKLTPEAFFKEMDSAYILHICDPYSFVSEKYPKFSQLFTWKDAILLQEIEKTKLRPSVVILDFPGSALGLRTPGDDIESFGRIFLSSGVDTVLANISPDPYAFYASFWKEFYRNIAQGRSAASAYRKAAIEGKKTAVPMSYWSKIMVMGI